MKTNPIHFLCLTTVLAVTAGCAPGPSGNVAVEGTLAGATSATLTLSHRWGVSSRRVVEANNPGIGDLDSLTLRVRSVSGGPFRDEFVLAAVVEDPKQTEPDGAGTQVRYDGDDPDWVKRRLGTLALLSLPVGAGSAGKSATRTVASESRQAAGSAWLSRLEDSDQVIPWSINEGDGRCRTLSPSWSFVAPPAGQTRDCFDLGTLSAMVLAHMAKAVTEGLDDGPLPSLVTAARHDLFIVPALSQINSTGGPGFGFIYAAELRIGERGGPSLARVYVPVSINFGTGTAAAGPTLEAVVAPLGDGTWSSIGIGRVTLAIHSRAMDTGLARAIRSVIVDRLERAAITPLEVDGAEVPWGQAIGKLIADIAPPLANTQPGASNLDVIALPANRSARGEETIPTHLLSLPRVSTRISTGGPLRGFAPNSPARAQAVATGNGSMRITTPLDPPGRIRRVTTLSPMQAGDPYELRILR